MGHYAQYRKRGSAPPGGAQPSNPLPPEITYATPLFSLHSASNPNTGGQFLVYKAMTKGGTEVYVTTVPWDHIGEVNVALIGAGLEFWLIAYEIGGGIEYVGPSQPSDAYHHIPE